MVLSFSSHVIGNTIDKSKEPWLALGQERLNSIPLFSSPRSSPRQLSGQIGSDHVGGSGERALEEERSRDGTKKKRRGGRNDDDEKRPTRKKVCWRLFSPSARCGNSLPRLKTPLLETTVVATMELSFAFLAASSSIGGGCSGDLNAMLFGRMLVLLYVLPQKYI